MDPYINEWLNLAIRFAHLVTGIAWIGASFYFVWLDNHLETPPKWKDDKGIKGDLWAIHGGGFYEVAKYQTGPAGAIAQNPALVQMGSLHDLVYRAFCCCQFDVLCRCRILFD